MKTKNLKFRDEMKAGIIFIVLIVVYSTNGICIPQNAEHPAQSDTIKHTGSGLDELYKQSNEKVISLESADNMLKGARSISLNDLNDEQGDKLMKVYRSVSEAYAANFRFKPAYLVYDEYISLKNTFVERKKSQRLQKIDVETNQMKDDNILKISANEGQITGLQSDNESLLSAKANVYRTIWIVVIIVAFLSGAIIWFINHKYVKAKQHLTNNRNRMMEVALTSSLGEFSANNGNGSSNNSTIEQLKSDLSKMSDALTSQNKVTKEISSLLLRRFWQR